MSQRFARFRRHLEGWELGVVAIGIALVSSLLAVPRAVVPDVLPVPWVDRAEQRREHASDRALLESAQDKRLAYDVRAVGEAFRRCGALLSTAHAGGALDEIAELRRSARLARAAHGNAAFLALRAVQSELFVAALREWEATGQASPDLNELGGDFLTKAKRSGWILDQRKLVLDEQEQRVLFRARWADLTGLLDTYPFSLSLNEWRAYYRFLLEHPESGPYRPGDQQAALWLLKYVAALERRDPEYLSALSRGILRYWLGEYDRAAADFRLHLSRHPHGPWRLRAQNHLVAALHPPP